MDKNFGKLSLVIVKKRNKLIRDIIKAVKGLFKIAVKKSSNKFLRAKIRKESKEMAMTAIKKAIKNDDDKPRMYLLPSAALTPIAAVLTYGAKPPKYSEFNYKMDGGLDWDRVYSACLRHLVAWNAGEDIDPESKLPHLSHAGAGIVMLLDLVNSKIGKDTRFKV